ncbi:cardiolipin synthase [Kiritimatiellaeota bacterium B1221]|nr:cardiolipin synthase [Kiritimatiellaeota bacterium B1221]
MFIFLFFTAAQIAGVISSFHALMGTRTSQGAIAWIVSLNTFPVVAVPAYWIFGRNNFNGYVSDRQKNDEDLKEIISELVRKHPHAFPDTDKVHPGAHAAEQLARLPILKGNQVELLVDGEKTFASIFEGIAAAQSYVLVQFFIVKDDDLGRKLKELLIKKAEEGVQVYFLYDEVGSQSLPASYLEDLRAAGAFAHNFHTRKGPQNRFQINFRNHRKIVVTDGDTGWVGGHNVGDEYLDGGKEFSSWRDTHIKISGPASLALQQTFVEDWNWATDNILQLDWESGFQAVGNQDILIIPSGPADTRETATLMFTHAINSAKKRIWIASPYFVPDEGVLNALELATLRGVDVRILIPDEPDHLLVYLAAFSYLKKAGSGVRVWRYTAGFMHQKVLLVDDTVSSVGTANFDNRSFRLNFEITALIIDPAFNQQVEKMLLVDFENSEEMDPEAIDDKSIWFQMKSRAASLAAPIL